MATNKLTMHRKTLSTALNNLGKHALSAGQIKPIDLPVVNFKLIENTLGPMIKQGDVGTIYSVKGSKPARVYKIIPLNRFKNGDEIRISKIAGDIGVSPAFHGAFVLDNNSKFYVVIEMDYAGASLSQWTEKLAENQNTEEPTPKIIQLSEEEKKLQDFLKTLLADSRYPAMVAIKQKPKLSLEEALEIMYDNPEIFYFELFNNIKKLAESCISYGDTHYGNILPNPKTGMKLIDFDGATLEDTPQAAAQKSLASAYNQLHIHSFFKLPNLSPKSKQLIQACGQLANQTQETKVNNCT